MMKLRAAADRITWQTACVALAVAAVAAWSAGFFVGLVVKFVFGQ